MLNYDLFTLGEILMDMTPHKVENRVLYQANPGGAPFNVMKMAKAFDITAGFAGKVGHDKFGEDLRSLLQESDIDDTYLMTTDKYNTTLAFVHLEENGERSFSFYRNNSADYQLTYEECQWQNMKCKNFYFGSVSLSKSPMKETIHTFLKKNKNSLDYVFFDPNYRPLLWQNSQRALDEIKKVIEYVDVIKVSDEEALWLTGQETYKEAITELHKLGIKVIYLTLGDQGSLLSIDDKTIEIPPYKPHKVIDTTGAGDAFFGSVIGYLLSQKKSHDLRVEDFIKAGNYGNVAGGLCVEGYGAVPSYPTKKDIEFIINGMKCTY